MPEFEIKVHNNHDRFWIEVFHEARKVAEFGWHGGEFLIGQEHFEVRGPYHGLDDYLVFKLTPMETFIKL